MVINLANFIKLVGRN